MSDQPAREPLPAPYRDNQIHQWINKMIHGPLGFVAWEENEYVDHPVNREHAIGDWILKCLGNNPGPETQYVVDQIVERRKEKFPA